MKFKIGRFTGYKPDIEAIDILKAIFIHFDKNKNHNANSSNLQKFFFRMKSEHPKLFEDIYFNDDSWLAYSREIELAYFYLQENKTIESSSNFSSFKICVDNDRLKKEISERFLDSQIKSLEEIARKFEKEIIMSC